MKTLQTSSAHRTRVHLTIAALLLTALACTSPSSTPTNTLDTDTTDVQAQSTDAPPSVDTRRPTDAPTDTAPNTTRDSSQTDTPADTNPTDTAPTDTATTDTNPTDTAPTDTAPEDTTRTDTAPIDATVDTSSPQDTTPRPPARFLALGDSYTIGERVAVSERWPVQLVEALRADGAMSEDAQIIARTGWTTGDLDAAIDREMPEGPYTMVSLLIGVNDQFRGGTTEAYRPAFQGLLARAIAFAGDDPGRVFVVSIPDWGVTPFATRTGRDSAQIAAEIDAFNAINRDEAQTAGVAWIDVTPISREAATDDTLLATDGLHPSGEMYRRWVELIEPVAAEIVDR